MRISRRSPAGGIPGSVNTYNGYPNESPDGMITVFTTPTNYTPGTLQVCLNGMVQTPDGEDYTEGANQFTFVSAPYSDDIVRVRYNES